VTRRRYRVPPRPLTPDQAARVIDAAGRGWVGTRNRAALVLMYRCGLRANEICEQLRSDLQVDEGELRVSRPKGYARGAVLRCLGVDPKTMKLVKEWLEQRSGAQPYLFHTQTGGQLQTSYLRQLMPRLAHRAGITQRVHPHCLRHTFARTFYNDTKDIMLLMLALGHSRPDTTQNYLRSLGADEVIEATTRREW
jgi:integrase